MPRNEPVGPMIPFASRVVPAEHRRRLLGFLRDSESEIALHEPLERLGRMVRGLILFDHLAEPKSRRKPLAGALLEVADLHLLAREMVVKYVEL